MVYKLNTATAVRVAVVGDSITAGDQPNNVQGLWQTSAAVVRDWLSWATFFANPVGSIIYHRNAGWPGDTSGPISAAESAGKNVPINNTGVRDRIQRDVIQYNPDICVVLAGTNDGYYSVPVNEFAANMTTIFQRLQSAGITPIACTITPRNPQNFDTLYEQYNLWLRSYCALNGIPVCDFYSLLVNPATNQQLAPVTHDSLHPSCYGTMLMGQALAKVINGIVFGSNCYLPGTDLAGSTNNLIPGGLFQAGAGGVGTGWLNSGTAVPTLVAGTAGMLGQWQRLTTPAGASSSNILSATNFGGWNVGDVLRISALFQFNYPVNTLANPSPVMSLLRNGAIVENLWPQTSQFNFTSVAQAIAFGPGLLMREYKVPPGCTSLALYLGLAGVAAGAWHQWAQVSVINLTQLGIPSALYGTT